METPDFTWPDGGEFLDRRTFEHLESAGDYRGSRRVSLVEDPAARRLNAQARRAWEEFFAARPSIDVLDAGRPRQDTIELVSELTTLRQLWVHDGVGVRDLRPLARLRRLEWLHFAGGRNLTDLAPLTRLSRLRSVAIWGVSDTIELQGLQGFDSLRDLAIGGGLGGRWVDIPGFDWIRSMTGLRRAAFPSLRPRDPDLSPFAALPHLIELRLPPRAEFRAQVAGLAARHPAFARLEQEFAAGDRANAQA